MAKLLISQYNDVFVVIRKLKKKIRAGICHVGLVF